MTYQGTPDPYGEDKIPLSPSAVNYRIPPRPLSLPFDPREHSSRSKWSLPLIWSDPDFGLDTIIVTQTIEIDSFRPGFASKPPETRNYIQKGSLYRDNR